MENEQRFDEAEVYAALGLDVPAEQSEVAGQTGQTGEKGPDVTDPAGAQKGTQNSGGVTGEEVGAPGGSNGGRGDPAPTAEAASDSGRTQGAPATDGTDDGRGDPANAEMSKEERARQAAARRERETQQRIDAALKAEREKHQGELKRVFERAGMTDRYNGNKPITTMEEFDAWDKAGQAAGLSRRLQEGKLTAEDFQRAIDNSPAVREAKELTEQIRAREQAAQQEAKKAQFQQMVDREMEAIRALDPSVTSLTDIITREGGQEFMELVEKNGLSYLQAFKLSNADRLAKAQVLAAAEGKARSQHGKDHMRSVASGDGFTGEVPRETVEFYRQLDPGMSMEDIRKDYARRIPRKK